MLNLIDCNKSGVVLISEFEKVLHRLKTFLSREELKILYSQYQEGHDSVNYNRISKDYDFHKRSFDRMHK